MTLRELQDLVYKTQREHFPPNDNRDQKMLLIVGEIAEAQEELRAGHSPTEVYYADPYPYSSPKVGKPEGYPIELADALIRILNLMSDDGIDAETAIVAKNAYNATRPYMHGRKF